MKFVTVALSAAILCAVVATAKSESVVIGPDCAPLRGVLKDMPASGALYLHTPTGWDVVPRTERGFLSLFGRTYPLLGYNNNALHFIYVAGAMSSSGRSFLVARVTSPTDDDVSQIVNLRRHKIALPRGPHIGAYQDYHLKEVDSPSILYIFHTWRRPSERSDSPTETRRSYAFDDQRPAIRRVLSLSYMTSLGRVTCVPFRLGPSLEAWSSTEVGEGEIPLLSPVTVSVTETKNADGKVGATFNLKLEVAR